jgi:60 kDa SS-A/Ro ribonucleoprotein
MANYTEHFNTKTTKQTERTPGRTDEVANNAGGFVFKINEWDKLNRFLMLGSEGGTYYVGEKELTKENAQSIVALIQKDGKRVVETIVKVSDEGRAAKNDPAIFALTLALTFGNPETKQAGYAAIKDVCRTGTHLFTLAQYIQDLRGWSRGLRKGVAAYYEVRQPESLAYQLIKYRQRDGWTHKDVLKIAHPGKDKTQDSERARLYRWALGKPVEGSLPAVIQAFEEAQKLTVTKADVKRAVSLVTESKLPWEALPTELLREKAVWEALLPDMPLTALIRNLGRMSNIGLLTSNLDDATRLVKKKLSDNENIKKSRLHPLNILNALKTYSSGGGYRGKMTWSAVQGVVDTLDEVFYASFGNVEPTGKRIYKALDVSGSMSSEIANTSLSCREASVALAMVSTRIEDAVELRAFGSTMIPFKISAKARLDKVCSETASLPWSGTDCSLPVLDALEKGLKVDVFEIYTDSETYAGRMKPFQALEKYRKATGIPARMIVVGMTSTDFSIADPSDKLSLDVAGFDTNTPAVISDFSMGRI